MATSALTDADALAMAGRIFYELSGRRVIWPLLDTEETFTLRPGRRYQIIRLSGQPIKAVESVTYRRGTVESVLPFSRISSSKIRLDSAMFGSDLCMGEGEINVRYTYGAKPPAQILHAIQLLADELQTADSDPGACQLPTNIKSVARQGFNMTMETADEIIASGGTGVDEVDKALAYFNSTKSKRRARVVSATVPPSTRQLTRTHENGASDG